MYLGRNCKASPSARHASAASTVCWNIDIFNKDRILLTHFSQSFSCNSLILLLLLFTMIVVIINISLLGVIEALS
jgi:hypothetical protein